MQSQILLPVVTEEEGLTKALYERLCGSGWEKLSDTVRKAHPGSGSFQARGFFRVQHGRRLMARLLAILLRLPSESHSTAIQLAVTPIERGERWERTFGDRRLITHQSATNDNLLAERFGPVEFKFRLCPDGDGLIYLQQGAELCFGRLRLPLKTWLAPQVHSVERAVGATSRTHVIVSISLAPLGMILRYEGELLVEENSA